MYKHLGGSYLHHLFGLELIAEGISKSMMEWRRVVRDAIEKDFLPPVDGEIYSK